MRLSRKKAIITGAANGIGRAIFLRFVEEGAMVVGVDQDEMGLDETISRVADPNAQVYKYVSDVSSKKSARARVLVNTPASYAGIEYWVSKRFLLVSGSSGISD